VISKAEFSSSEYITREIVPKVAPLNCTVTDDICVLTLLSAVTDIAGMFSTTNVSTPDPSMGNWLIFGAWVRAHLPLGLIQFLPPLEKHALHQRADNTWGDGTKYVNVVDAVLGANWYCTPASPQDGGAGVPWYVAIKLTVPALCAGGTVTVICTPPSILENERTEHKSVHVVDPKDTRTSEVFARLGKLLSVMVVKYKPFTRRLVLPESVAIDTDDTMEGRLKQLKNSKVSQALRICCACMV
jgi:hypothetical protein